MGPCGQLARTFGPLARLAAATGRVVNTFEPIARSDQFKEILNRVCEHRDRPRNAASRRSPHAAIADSAGLAENIDRREIHDFVAASAENCSEHEEAKALRLVDGNRW